MVTAVAVPWAVALIVPFVPAAPVVLALARRLIRRTDLARRAVLAALAQPPTDDRQLLLGSRRRLQEC
ncbi:MAG TPA: hypothetical protein VF171_05055, partial [Trueperaceae bacterium]